MIKTLFFASLREQVGQSSTEAPWQAGLTPARLWQLTTGQAHLPDHILMARNQAYCAADTPLEDGDEVAFFPPVTGG